MLEMARNYRFYKKSFLEGFRNFIKTVLSVFAIIVLLYYYQNGNLINALEIYLFEFPLQLINSILLIIFELCST